MGKIKEETYTERAAADRQLAREFDLTYFEDWLRSLPDEEGDKKAVVIGSKEYSIRDMLDEIRKGTDNEERFRRLLREIRLARSGAVRR